MLVHWQLQQAVVWIAHEGRGKGMGMEVQYVGFGMGMRLLVALGYTAILNPFFSLSLPMYTPWFCTSKIANANPRRTIRID